MPRRQKKWKAEDGETAASKKIITEQAAEPMESETSNATPESTASTATVNTATAAKAQGSDSY
ncbi:hypothetical protein DPMN_091676 [Dreissena polymorpha]|uniref:Uncharacterized protein n=1 Tax=Dreissena polymorpha TaxID=45954 RepID=A0A9D4L0L5_DREPO|nr:hypothetical protein DPMN_091676 [Dreissena polymorpha]